MRPIDELKQSLAEVADLSRVSSILGWDQATYMPPGGATARGRQMALIDRLAHERLSHPKIGQLLDRAEREAEQLPPQSLDRALVRVARRDFEQASRVPTALVAERSEHSANAFNLWTRARPANDFGMVREALQKTLELSRRTAECFPGFAHIADPLIDFADPGMTVAVIRKLFADLASELAPLVKGICAQPVADESCIRQHFPESEQWKFGLEVVRQFGYDLERGRQDKTHHPFCTTFSIGDVRITTRFREDDLGDGLFSTLHEAGHAMYEQGNDPQLEGSMLQGGISAGVHESQSRLWENVVGRSLPFWRYFYPRLQRQFSGQLGKVPLETFYRAINRVTRSLIRVDADEVTYNLHVMLRFDLELDLLEGKLSINDLPEAWRARYKELLGEAPPNDQLGVLQDVHWYGGTIGGSFQGYALGNILSAQFFAAAVRVHPEIPSQIERGEFHSLHRWLASTIYQHGRAIEAPELIRQASGSDISIAPYMRYLQEKYGAIYKLS